MKAKAKINLFLHITGKNHYHTLESLVVFADDVFDEIRVAAADDTTLAITGEFGKSLSNTNNLVLKAAKLLQAHTKLGANIHLHKALPISSGIGGGSADAACTMKLLCNLWGLELSQGQIKEYVQLLGSDVYCCYLQQACYLLGVGEKLQIIAKLPLLYAVLVNPLIEVSTKIIFDHYRGAYTNWSWGLKSEFHSTDELISFIKNQHNDLQPVTASIFAEINLMNEILNAQENCLLARMSGSGATCFGLFANMNQAQLAANNILAKYPKWWVRTTTLS
jgi:4-diphosphocytidyl-2-C-methyl-D-erythritol kinase